MMLYWLFNIISHYEHVTFYENVEVGPPTKSNRGAHNETVTPLVVDAVFNEQKPCNKYF